MMMKKIKIYIVTYNDSPILNSNLDSLFASDDMGNVEVNIINNHTNFSINPKHELNVNVLHNVLRPDFSNGHLTRDYNSALINGFKNLNNPDADIVLPCHDDTLWRSNWKELLIEIHSRYTFYTCGWGCGLCSYTPDAVKQIGLWDERFNGITHHEFDYYLRAYMYNNSLSSINDDGHHQILNPESPISYRSSPPREHNGRMSVHGYTGRLFHMKWDFPVHGEWSPEIMPKEPLPCKIPNYVLYEYFERDINKEGRNYS